MTGKEIYRKLIKAGWIETTSKGSHRKLKKDGKIIIVPYHTTELAKGTERAIMKHAGLK